MAKFKCVHSGCIYEWFDEDTLKNMREHSEYEEIEPVTPVVKPIIKKEKQ